MGICIFFIVMAISGLLLPHFLTDPEMKESESNHLDDRQLSAFIS